MSGEEQSVVRCVGVSRIYEQAAAPVRALRNLDFEMARGDFVSLVGPSGSGKSTLLNLIGGLDQATEGEVFVDGVALTGLNQTRLADMRLHRDRLRIPVLQPHSGAFRPGERGVHPAAARGAFGRPNAADPRKPWRLWPSKPWPTAAPAELSGGQQQRVAIARAIVTNPVLLLADEPSANLDSAATGELLKLLRRLNDERGLSILTATHDPLVMRYAKRRMRLRDGAIVKDPALSPGTATDPMP